MAHAQGVSRKGKGSSIVVAAHAGRHFARPAHMASTPRHTVGRRARSLACAGMLACVLAGGATAQASALATPGGADGLEGFSRADYEPHVTPVIREETYVRVTLSAVGDNLMNMPVVAAADANAGETGDGWYDFTPMYAGVADIVAGSDLNFIDIETILGGDELGLSGYPTFNSPSCIAQQVADFGWNLATTATNHAWDMGLAGIENSSATWAEHPEVLVTGTFTSPEDRTRIRMTQVRGMRVALLAYTDYLNGYVLPEGQEWTVATADADAMATDVARARAEGADVVIVAMSWGDENSFEPNDAQRFYAQHLANLGVDVIVGFGPHVIQPVEWVDALDETGAPTGHSTLVAYSLGNFLSNQPLAAENVEGCLTLSLERLGQHGPVSVTDVAWTPLVNHISAGWHQVFRLADYPDELARAHESLGQETDPLAYAWGLTYDVAGAGGAACIVES